MFRGFEYIYETKKKNCSDDDDDDENSFAWFKLTTTIGGFIKSSC